MQSSSMPKFPPFIPYLSIYYILIKDTFALVFALKVDHVHLLQVFIEFNLRDKDAQATVKAHIKLLHDYNEIRDVGQGLMGIIADTRGVRVRDVYADFDVGEGD